MRIVFIGAGTLTRTATRMFLDAGHEVVIIESDLAIIEEYEDRYDCSFLHGDGSRPTILAEVDPPATDCLFCLAGEDTANILSAVVARSMDFGKIVVRIEDDELLPVCAQLGLEHVIVPDRRLARELLSFAEGDSRALDAEAERSGD